MRTAILPSGEALNFTDETPDEVMHSHVRARMGLPPIPNPLEQAHQNTQAAHAQTQQVMMGSQQTTQQLGQIAVALHQQVDMMMQVIQQAAMVMAQSTQQANQVLAQAAEQISQAAAHMTAVAGQMHESTQHHIASMQDSTEKHMAAADATNSAIGDLGSKLENHSQTIVKAVTSPKKVVKGKDGAWTSVPSAS